MPVSSREWKRRQAQARRNVIDAINTSEYLDQRVEEEVFYIIENILKESGLPTDIDALDAIRDGIRVTKPWASRKIKRKGAANGGN